MFHFTRNRKIIFTVVIATALCLVLSIFLPITHSQPTSNFTLPCKINTTGSAWSGDIAFDLELGAGFMGVGGTGNYFVVMNTNGTLLSVRESASSYGPAYNIAPDTLMFEGEPQVGTPDSAWPTWVTNFLNLTSNTIETFPNVLSEHDIQYDPVNNTFLTFQDYVRQVGNNPILYDRIAQVDPSGNVLWSWDTYNYIPLSEISPYNETDTLPNGQTVMDVTHANTLDWDYNNSIIYLNLRNTNTFYAINQTTGNIIWACGEFGNFTLLGANGQPLVGANDVPPSLWYHCHDVKEVAPDVFLMFDNDYENNTNPDNCHSEILEVTLNQTSMTAYVNWSWEAPTQYWTSYGGGALLLPNGDFIGDFGDPTHQLQQDSENGQNLSWNFNDTGAVFVEVNPAGQVVRTWTFPVGWYVYRIIDITDPVSVVFPTPTPTPVATSTPTPVVTLSPTPVATSIPTPIVTSTPSVLPSSTPSSAMNSQMVIAAIAFVAGMVVVVLLADVFYVRKRITNPKIDSNIEALNFKLLSDFMPYFSRILERNQVLSVRRN